MDDKTIKQLNDTLQGLGEELKNRKDNESPIWNASHIGDVPINTKGKKDGWGFLYNKGSFEMYPIGENKFYDHNELTNYKKEEHVPLNDSKIDSESIWSSKKINEKIVEVAGAVGKKVQKDTEQKIKESRTQSNINLNKTVKQSKIELEKLIKDSKNLGEQNKKDLYSALKRLDQVDKELSVVSESINILGVLQGDKSAISKLSNEIHAIETQMSALVDIKLGKIKEVTYTKGEVNKKIKQLSDRLAKINTKTKEAVVEKKGLSDEEIKLMIDDRTPYGHKHRSSEIVHDGGSLDEYLANLTVGGLPDQTGNSGKFLTTDGSDASWGTPSGSGDMLAATYDPLNKAANAFSTDNHVDGTTNKVYSATEKTKLSGIEASADVTDATNVAAAGAVMEDDTSTVSMSFVVDEDNMVSNSATKLATQQSIKAYVDTAIGTTVLDSELIATSAGAGDAGKPIKLDAAGHVDATMINDADISLDSVTEGSTNKFYTSTEKTKLSGIETAADVTDAANVSAAGAPIISSGAGAPGSTPTKVGDIYIDTTGDDAYIAVGTASSADWEKSNDGAGGGVSDGDKGDITVSASGATYTIDNDVVTYAKMQNASAENKILGRITAGAGDIEELTAANVRTIINVEDGADVTDTTNVTAAGALMDSEVDADIKTLSLPAGTTISTFGASIIDDADEATFKATVNLEIGTDVQAYNADLTSLATNWVQASASGASSLDFHEDTDNGTNKVTVIAPASVATSDKILTLPDATDTLVGKATTDTLTNKTLTSPKINEDVAVTATATEINVLDGIPATLTATELGYVDGVTSAIQTQITAKAAHATTLTVAGTTNEITSSAGAQDLSANRTWTLSLPATIDLGGKTSLEIPNGAGGTTLDTTGEIGIDSTSKTLNFYDGANEVVLNPVKSISLTVMAVVATDDFPFHRMDVACTLVKVSYLCLGGTNWVGQVVEMDANGGTPTDVHSADITASAGTVNTSTTFSNASIDAGDYIGIETTSISGTPTTLTITVYYRENA